jgi:hypothetical protein
MVRSTLWNPLVAIDPPERVLIDLSCVFPRSPHHQAVYTASGMKASGIVDGTLSMLGITTEGERLAYVTYRIEFGGDSAPVTHWVPEWILERR